MKKFISLEIRADDEQKIVGLLSKLKQLERKTFSYQKKLSESYAENVFLDILHSAVFKTKRKSLFESCVWVYVSKGVLRIANITSPTVSNLGVVNYNIILKSFYNDFVSNCITKDFNVQLTGEEISIKEILNADTWQKLSTWEATCNKESPTSNPQDRDAWMDFVIALCQHEDKLTSSDLQQWLQEDKGWPMFYTQKIEELGWLLDYSVELLKRHQNK